MNIAQGLKIKNRLAGQIADLQRKIQVGNRFTSATGPTHDVPALQSKLVETRKDLIQLKARIAIANAGIAQDLFELAEQKACLTYLGDLKDYCLAAPTISYQGVGRDQVKEITNDSQIRLSEVEADIEATQNRINDLQDRIDAYNATTQI